MKRYCILLFLFNLIFCLAVFGQSDRQLIREKGTKKQKRLALVIGNGSYATSPLRNPVNDAKDMAVALRSVGFEVILHTDINQNRMKRAISSFGKKLRTQGGTGLFYFAGHGVQVRGKNYLIPVGARVETEEEVEFEGVDVGRLLAQLRSARNSMNIVILDACRNNPFARSYRSSDKGLASIDAPGGTLIAYATAPGSVASDGTGRNGLYTQELLKQIKTPGLSIEEAFKQVRVSVRNQTENKQTPWESSSLTGSFYFNPTNKANTTNSGITKNNPTPSGTASATERAAWDLVKDSNSVGDLQLYLQEYPNGFYSATAREKVRQIETSERSKNSVIENNAWNAVKDSENPLAIQGFLNKYPNSEKAPLARILLKKLEREGKGRVRTNSIGMELVYVPPGDFMMGSSSLDVDKAFSLAKLYNPKAKREWFNDETPQRRVTIKKGFWMGKFEVTQAQWRSVMGSVPTSCYGKYNLAGETKPVVCVSWDDAKEFIRKLNAKNDGFRYSLPSEAEWEYAARAGTTTNYYWGDDSSNTSICDYGNFGDQVTKEKYKFSWLGNPKCRDGYAETAPVGSYKPNNFGLYDMSGNVWEWVEDIYNKNGYRGLSVDGSANLTMGDSSKRVLRGGSWSGSGSSLRSAVRGWVSPSYRDGDVGFRVVARPSAL